MNYHKEIKVSKQGGTSFNIPNSFCKMLNIVPGDRLHLCLNTETKQVTFQKIEKQTIKFKELPESMQELLKEVRTTDNYEELEFEINHSEENYPCIKLLED